MYDIPSPLMGLEAELTRLAELRNSNRGRQLQPLASGPSFRQTLGRAMIRAGDVLAGHPHTRR